MPIAHASPGCMDWLHVLDSGWGLLWRIIRGIWILDYFGFWQTYLLAIRRLLRLNLHFISDALRVDSGVFRRCFLVKFSLWLIALYHLLMRHAISSV
jgi:hypothetical protein